MKSTLFSVLASTGLSTSAVAQTYENAGAAIYFEVWNGSNWTHNVDIAPGARVEWRVRVQYTGTRTDIHGLGEVWWQAVFANADNTGSGIDADQVGTYMNGGTNGNAIPNSMVTTADGYNGAALPGYGRVFSFGLAAMQPSTLNTLTTFRHNSGADGAPAGSYIRIAGSGSAQWAPSMADTAAGTTTSNTQLIQRGIQSNQTAQALNPAQFTAGLNVVVFRGAYTVSTEISSPTGRVVSLGTDERFLRRVGGATSSDNRRYIAWQTGVGDTGTGATGHRTYGVTIHGATFGYYAPSPGAASLLVLGAIPATRRRR